MKRSLVVIAVATALDIIGGWLFSVVEHLTFGLGLYWAVVTATTTGYGDVIPKTALGHVIAVGVMLTVIPLFAATFSLLTSGLTAVHVHRRADETHDLMRQHHEEHMTALGSKRDPRGRFTK